MHTSSYFLIFQYTGFESC